MMMAIMAETWVVDSKDAFIKWGIRRRHPLLNHVP